jgi:pimeloyl-ACP methyl ester carboxylesterase
MQAEKRRRRIWSGRFFHQVWGDFSRPVLWLFAVAALCVLPAEAQAQRAAPKSAQQARTENVTLETEDGVRLAATYYAGVESKETVPVMLVHGWDGSRGEMQGLALYLQRLKHSVIAFDLRGHGQSLEAISPRGVVTIERDRFRKPQIEAMYRDLNAAKRYLLARNNEEKLNIELLCVVGVEFGATLALNWAMWDWNVRSLPAYKRGQDVKALVLISPDTSFRGVTPRDALQHPVVGAQLPVFIAVGGQESRRLSDARSLHKSLERFRTDPEEQGLIFNLADTSLQGAKLIDAQGVQVAQNIAVFIDQQLVKRAEFLPWRDRSGPFDD